MSFLHGAFIQQGDFYPPVILNYQQYQNDKKPPSQPEALLDEGFHGTAALVGSLAFVFVWSFPKI